MVRVTLNIFRFNPERDRAPYYQEFQVEAEPGWRILDCLGEIKGKQDGTLTYRRSCGHGVCGSDAMKINGVNRLACQYLVKDLKRPYATLEPLPQMPVIKDLVVDMTRFFEHYEAIEPYLKTRRPPPEGEYLQTPEERRRLDGSYECILCGCCTSACPSFWANPNYLGPAALLRAYRYTFDSRDEATDARLRLVDHKDGVWMCHTIFNCMECCPKGLNPAWAIGELKKKIIRQRF